MSSERRTLEQQRLDGAVWAAEVRRGSSVAEIAARHDVEEAMIYRDLTTAGYLLAALRAEIVPDDGLMLLSPDPEARPAWTRLSEYEIAFLHRVRDEIRAADRAEILAEARARRFAE